MNPLLFSAIALVRAWTRLYTSGMDTTSRDSRRAEIESDLWEFHEDARRHGWSPAAIAVHMLARLGFGLAHDLLWRVDYEKEAVMLQRRTAWFTAAAIGGAACVAALWIVFAVTTLVALPPLPDSIHIERVYLQPMRPPPPPSVVSRTFFEPPIVPPPPPPPPLR